MRRTTRKGGSKVVTPKNKNIEQQNEKLSERSTSKRDDSDRSTETDTSDGHSPLCSPVNKISKTDKNNKSPCLKAKTTTTEPEGESSQTIETVIIPNEITIRKDKDDKSNELLNADKRIVTVAQYKQMLKSKNKSIELQDEDSLMIEVDDTEFEDEEQKGSPSSTSESRSSGKRKWKHQRKETTSTRKKARMSPRVRQSPMKETNLGETNNNEMMMRIMEELKSVKEQLKSKYDEQQNSNSNSVVRPILPVKSPSETTIYAPAVAKMPDLNTVRTLDNPRLFK